MPKRRVLVVDDDENIVRLVSMYLEKDGYRVDASHDGRDALTQFRRTKPDIVVLDLMLPEIDGLNVCRTIREQSDVPIIMLTARTTEGDKLIGLDQGADDYVTKPFSPRELLARIRAVLRRAPGDDSSGPVELRHGDVVLNLREHVAYVRGEQVPLTPTEFSLLQAMMLSPGQAFTRGQLIERAFGHDFEGFERNVDVHINSLRKKVEPSPGEPSYIRTVYGVGYKLDAQVHA
ncbi:MAG TPA: response regulator transcription factor [Chloroflexota bacterium]|jgi:DNA-binding response OmpR family regulator|nr:response regulator transcription factor [Chloroflexota bacterium]